jgi:hypothetical protein
MCGEKQIYRVFRRKIIVVILSEEVHKNVCPSMNVWGAV